MSGHAHACCATSMPSSWSDLLWQALIALNSRIDRYFCAFMVLRFG
jgi:hypothetical protein